MTVLFIFLAVMSLDEFHTKKSQQNPKRAKSEAVNRMRDYAMTKRTNDDL
jgi:hypothetical protein